MSQRRRFARRPIDEPLHDVDRLGPAGAAIGHGRRGIAEDEAARHRHRPDVVDGRGELQRKQDRDGTRTLDIGADIVRACPAQRQKPAVRVERQFGTGILVAALGVAEKCLGS